MNIRNVVITTLLTFCTCTSTAQESKTVYNFLRLPVSAHAAALGGENITLTDDDATQLFHNPALISGVTDKTLNSQPHAPEAVGCFCPVFYHEIIEIRPISCFSNHIKKPVSNGQSIPVNRASHCKQLQQIGPVII